MKTIIPKFEKCSICGKNNRKRHYTENGIILICSGCGYQVGGKSELDAKLNWNKVMKNYIKK